MNVLSLFDGMSCGQIALERAGIKVNKYYASEIDKYAIKIAQKNYPNTIQLGNVLEVKAKNLERIDLLIGGSPCQGFSFAGKQLNFKDPRSKLFFEYVRLLKEVKPKYFLLENVKMKIQSQDIISKYLGVKPIKINSSLVSAQKRERIYWTNIPNLTQPRNKNIYLKDIVNDMDSGHFNILKYSEKCKKQIIKNSKTKFQKSIALCTNGNVTGSGVTTIHIKSNIYKKLFPLDCERLQTVPDNYTEGVSNTQRYKMLGNGWTVDVISHIFKVLKNDN